MKTYRILAVLILVTILSPIAMTETIFATSSEPRATDMHKTVNYFQGSFSPSQVTAVPNEPFDVSFSIRPTIDAPDTMIHFIMPADLITIVSGNAIWQGDLNKDETLTLSLSLATQGEVAAYVRANVESSESGRDYQSSYYLRVATSNAGSSPSGSMEPGFVRLVNLEYESTTSNPASSRTIEDSEDPISAGTFEVKGQWWYTDENGGWSKGRYMLARVRDADDGGFSVTQWTDGDGKFDFVITNTAGLRSPILDFIAEGPWDWKATNDAGAQYWWSAGVLAYNVPDGWLYENNGLGAGNNNEVLQAGDAVFLEANWVYWSSGVYWSRSKVTIRFPSGTWPHSHGDYIDLPLKSTAGWDHVTVQHEDGHCIMWTLYGNTWPPTAHGGESHYVFDEKDGGFAIIEGWAEFMQCIVDNNANNLADWYNGHGGNIETNDWFNCIDTGDMDGNDIEGSSASIIWDICDPVNIAGDNDHMAWGYEEIFTVMQNDHPGSMLTFWNDWAARWPTNSTSTGPLCSIYYHYGIDEDWFNPWGTVVINGGATYTTSRTVTLTLTGEDWGVGVKYMRFSEDWGVTWGGWYNYATTFTYSITSPGDGWKYIDVQYADYWWMSTPGTIYDGIGLDTTRPTGSITINAGAVYTTSRTVNLTLSASDNYSGVAKMRFSENMGAWSQWFTYNTIFSGILNSPGDGYKTIDVQYQDYAGQTSTAWAIWDGIYLDTTPPTGSIVIGLGNPPYTTTTSVTLYLNYSDATSGVYQARYGNAGGVWSAWEAPAATKAWTLSSGDGTKGVYYQLKDNAGLTSTLYYDSIILDTVAPTGSIIINNANPPLTPTTSVTLYLTYSDATSGVYQVRYSNDGVWDAEPWEAPAATKAWTLPAGNGVKTVYYQVKDNAGQLSTTYYDTIALNATTQPIFIVWTDKASYHIGETMKVYVRVYNLGNAAVPVKATIRLQLPNGNYYGPLLDMSATLPAHFDSGTVVWNQFTLPTVPYGNYKWIAELKNPTNGTLISQYIWNWQMTP